MHGFRTRHATSVCCSLLLCAIASTTQEARAQMPEPQITEQSVVRSNVQASSTEPILNQNRQTQSRRAKNGALSLP